MMLPEPVSQTVTVTGPCLTPGRRRLLQIVQRVDFGRIERLSICDGSPVFEGAFRIVEEIKLSLDSDRQADCDNCDATPKKEFYNLFAHLERLRDGIVDIEIRHGLPFRLVLERRYEELL